MRVSLVHNVTAGDREYEPADLVALLRDAGHQVVEFGKTKRDMARAIASNPDVVAVAGGDGTVAKAAIALSGSSVPLLILPTGTANNIARTLAAAAPVPKIVGAISSGRPVRLDLGRVSGAWGEKSFVEAVGMGFLGGLLRRGRTLRARLQRFVRNFGRPTDKRVEGAARGVARLVERHPARYHVVRASGEDLSGEYLAVEAMNIREIGPRLPLAPRADPGDGLLDLVLVPAERRAELVDYLASLGASGAFPPVVTRRVPFVELSWSTADGHVDDRPWPRPRDDARVRDDPIVRVEIRGAVTVLALRPSGVARSAG